MRKYQTTAITCSKCRKIIGSDEVNCPYCGAAFPKLWRKHSIWAEKVYDSDSAVRMIIGVNVVMYLLSLILYPIEFSSDLFQTISPSIKSLLLLGMTGTYPVFHLHRWWTPVSAGYLHAGIVHIAFNMLAFRQIGGFVMKEYGLHRMIILYTLCGVIGSWISCIAGTRLSLGASASGCGLIGAALCYGKVRGGVYGQEIYKQMSGWIIGIFVMGLMMPHIDNYGHAGGFLSGMVLGYILEYKEKKQETAFHKIFAGICAAGTVIVLAYAVGSGIYYRISQLPG